MVKANHSGAEPRVKVVLLSFLVADGLHHDMLFKSGDARKSGV